jgi:hypothetical protein
LAGNQSKHSFRLFIHGAILIRVGVKIPAVFHHKIVLLKITPFIRVR